MFNRKSILWIIIIVILAAGGGGYYYYTTQQTQATSEVDTPALQTAVARRGDLTVLASAAGEVITSSELDLKFEESGTILEIYVGLGEKVEAGQVLGLLETSNTAESIAYSVASAELTVLKAQQSLDAIHENWQMESAQALKAMEDAGEALENLYTTDLELAQANEEIALAESAIENLKITDLDLAKAIEAAAVAQQDVEDSEYTYRLTQSTATQSAIDQAYASIIIAEESLEKAQERFDRVADKPDGNLSKAQAQASLSSAQLSYDQKVINYNVLSSPSNETEQAVARTAYETALVTLEDAKEALANLEAGPSEYDLALAEQELLEAQEQLTDLLTGPTPGEIAIAEAEIAQAESAWETLKEGPDPDEIALAEAELANSEAKLALEKEAQVYVELTAPYDGTILAVNQTAGSTVSTSTSIFTLADLDQPLLTVYLDETDLDKVGLNYEAEVIFDALPDDLFIGHIIEINPSLVKVSGVSAVETTVQLDADSFAKPLSLPVGMNASVEVIGGRAENAILIPVEALREISTDEYAVFVVGDDGEPKLRMVEVGLIDYTNAEIISGLTNGEVVTTGIVETN